MPKASPPKASPPKASVSKATAVKRPLAASQPVCPRCGSPKFAAEPQTRAEGSRIVRYSMLVCERGHTFARPRAPA